MENINKIKEFDWSDKLVLVAEDQEINKIFFNKILTATKVKLLWASDGELAVTLAKMYDNINLILMDLRMPKLNGIEATKRIKAINKDIPVIAQTAYPEDGVREDCFKAGCNDFVTKPINVNLLLDLMNKYLHK